jgi:type II secretion system protein C
MSISSRSSLIISILLGLVVAKALWLTVEMLYLPKSGVDKEELNQIKPLHYRYSNLVSKRDKPKVASKRIKKRKRKKPPKKRPKPLAVKKFIIKGIIAYSNGDGIVTLKYKRDSYVLVRGEELEGFKLKRVYMLYAIFEKDGKEYKVEINGDKDKSRGRDREPNRFNREKEPPKRGDRDNKEAKKDEDIKRDGDIIVVSKNLINSYRKDINSIEKEINIVPIKGKSEIEGFKVLRIAKGSKLNKLGLKKGDIILAINGEELKDLNVPMEFIRNLDTISAVTFTIKRGNEIKELEYEIH